MFVRQRPHPFGNHYHSIFCASIWIVFGIELVKGKYHPKEIRNDPTYDNGITGGILIQLTNALYSCGKLVILDSGFYVLQVLTAIHKLKVFAGAVIKMRRYWPKHAPEAPIDFHMVDKEVGECNTFDVLDGEPYTIFCTKDQDYTMKMMDTYSGLKEPKRDRKTSVCTRKDNFRKELSTWILLPIILTSGTVYMTTITCTVSFLILKI